MNITDWVPIVTAGLCTPIFLLFPLIHTQHLTKSCHQGEGKISKGSTAPPSKDAGPQGPNSLPFIHTHSLRFTATKFGMATSVGKGKN